MLRSLYYSLPSSLRYTARRVWYAPLDLIDGLTGKRDRLTPPKGLIFTGGGDFRAQGEKFLSFFKDLGQLQPNHSVLDVGSGMGRMAIPLRDYLTNEGSYDGIDIVKNAVKWCNKHIGQSNFQFHHSDIYNDLYNSNGKVSGDEYAFPFDKNHFDFTFLTSVFTHMLPGETRNYIHEIGRTLKPGGKCFATFFIVNAESQQLMSETGIHFPHERGNHFVMNAKVQTANVGYTEDFIAECAKESGLAIDKIHFGKWCNRADFLDFQDIVIFRKL